MGLRTFLGLKKKRQPVYLNESYSQEGEDGILSRVFEYQQNGFYVDVGAHHPMRFSNTYKFYKLGWRGINIDAWPGSMEAFDKVRPLDTNIEAAISDTAETIPFYIFNEPALNTFSAASVAEYVKKDIYKVDRTVNLETRTLKNILTEFLPEGQAIDFLSVDAEGFDHKVLLSNNWTLFRPRLVLVETDRSLLDFMTGEVCLFMKEQGYELFAKTVKTAFFKEKGFEIS